MLQELWNVTRNMEVTLPYRYKLDETEKQYNILN